MATPLTHFLKGLKVALGDRFGAAKSDADLVDALVHVLRCGRVPGYAVTPGLDRVTPDLTAPLPYVQLIYGATLAVALPDAAANGFDTRAYKERLGDAWPFIHAAHRLLREAEDGAAADPGWQTVEGLMAGTDALGDVFAAQAPLTVTGSFPGINLSATGLNLA